ncbi:MAG: MlaA family lipoprotein, partial [Aeromonadaceae bacterium]
PAPIRDGVGNFVDNFDEPNNTVNNLLVGRFADSGRSALRFVLNTTLGLFGSVDVADGMGLSRRSMSMSTVLGKATMEQGPYFMVPVYGPTTLRNVIGDTADGLYFPYGNMTFAMRATHWVVSGLDSRSRLVDQEAVLDNSLDPYLSSKDFYLQYEEAKVQEGRAPSHSSGQSDDAELDRYMDEIDQ